MADDQGDEKTEEATDAKREEFRKKGQVATTRELASAAFLLAAAGLVYALGRFFFRELSELFTYSFGNQLVVHIRSGDFTEAMKFAAFKGVLLIAPALGVAGLIGFASSVVQTGFLQVEDALTPKFEKLDPIAGFKRLFSMRTLVEGLKSFLKMVFIIGVLYYVLKSEIRILPTMIHFNVAEMFVYIGTLMFKLFSTIGGIMLILALADYFFQRWDLEKQMMMTKQEVKEEHKQREGDPMIKSRIRQIQRQMATKRMMDDIPKATVVVTNPTHIAVVLKYDENLPAPQLVAKGADLVAEKIKEIAREHNIPILENKPLARTIFKTLKIGQVIPRELFVAVAEVISYVYKLKKRIKR
ncbi:MAG: flagellar biosynthesis protein FlhB [Bdellovibrionia bacterium]